MARENAREQKIVFTNGCFDLLHPGHLSLLEFASTFGEVVVGLNSDESVRGLKGPNRPIMGEEERRYSLESCKFVSKVYLFDEPTPLRLIQEIRPDLIIKGGEYAGVPIIGQDLAPVKLFTPHWDLSTTKILERIQSVD